MTEPHACNPWLCPPHVEDCDCPDPENSLCNPYYVAGHCPGEGSEDDGDPA